MGAWAQKKMSGTVTNTTNGSPVMGGGRHRRRKRNKSCHQHVSHRRFSLTLPPGRAGCHLVHRFETTEVDATATGQGGDHVERKQLCPETCDRHRLYVPAKEGPDSAVTVVNVSDMNKQPTSQIASQLQGQASGVTVVGSGSRGGATGAYRGINTTAQYAFVYHRWSPTQTIVRLQPQRCSFGTGAEGCGRRQYIMVPALPMG